MARTGTLSQKPNRVFISHSSRDEAIAAKLANALAPDAWVDKMDLDAGQMLPKSIAEGIQASKWFVLIASHHSMNSRWVRYELNLFLIHWIEQADCTILVVRIDDCTVHPELKPFLRLDYPNRVDEALREAVRTIRGSDSGALKHVVERRQRVVNRYEELEAIEHLIHENARFIHLFGIYGIGKTTVVSRAVEEIFRMRLVQLNMTEAHGTVRLALELCANAKIPLPKPSASTDEYRASAIDAVRALAGC